MTARSNEAHRPLMFVTGGSGFLGSAVTRAATNAGWDVAAPASKALDIRDRDALIEAVRELSLTAVVHLAYRKGDPEIIFEGSRNVAQAASACGSKLIHMSTDVVFGGRPEPYLETDIPDPANQYGQHKFRAEKAVAIECPTATIVRTSLLYGTDVLAPLQLDVRAALAAGPSHRPMTFFTDEYRCPAHVDDVATALVSLAGRTDLKGPIHVAGPDRVSRAGFAMRTASWLGLGQENLATSTIVEAGLERPANVVLDTTLARGLGITCRSLAKAYGESGAGHGHVTDDQAHTCRTHR